MSVMESRAGRLAKVRDSARDAGVDSLVITHLPNIYYLTGFAGTAGALFVSPESCRLIVDSRYVTAARSLASALPDGLVSVEPVARSYDETIADLVLRDGRREIGIEATHLSVARFNALSALGRRTTADGPGTADDGFRLVPASGRFDLVLAGDIDDVDRFAQHAPVIVIGRAEADAVDRVHAFRKGCDDYVPRPFDYQELVERIHAVLRRARPAAPDVLEAGPVRIDTRTRDVRVSGRRIHLSLKEYELLVKLAREPERVFTKAELLYDVWEYRAPARTRTLDSHASRLRRKLREAGASPEIVDNVWGVGYRLTGALPGE